MMGNFMIKRAQPMGVIYIYRAGFHSLILGMYMKPSFYMNTYGCAPVSLFERAAMRIYSFSLLILLFGHGLCYGQNASIRFNVTPQGFPPYVISTPPAGIMFDVLTHIAQQHNIQVVPERIPENRVYTLLDNNKLDAHASALEWVEHPEKYVFSDPVLKVRDVVFTREDYPFKFNKVEDLIGRSIGVHTGYSYQSLSQYFKNGTIKRLDSNNELYMLNMLSRNRLDIAIITEHVGLWIIKKNNITQGFNISQKAVDTTDYRMVFSKKWQPFVLEFNKGLVIMKENGKLKDILSQYR